ncbi:unnamed protein product [Adineta ricciae]|uniref:N-acetyltransferase domain-containing protein n=1 Tax=Adineta ricciae TaxID=249248 RepID=A0A814D2C2_ADIRI|nr:unnamed protein product [Adineta ricciae]
MADADLPLGEVVPNWTARAHPLADSQYHKFNGQYCRLEVLNSKTDEKVFQQLFDAFKPVEDRHYTYLKYGPFKTVDEFKEFVHNKEQPSSNTTMYTIFVNDAAVGFITYLRIDPDQGTIEIGHVNFGPQLVKTRAATEVVFLLLEYAFDTLRYRRVEWKTNALNSKSRWAAGRFGFQYEGTWLKAEIAKGRSRDNSWYSIIDDEWAPVKQEFQRWLKADNFDQNGQQLTKLNAKQANPRQRKITDADQEKYD